MGSELESPGRQFSVVITLAHLMSAARTGADAVPSQPACAGLGFPEPPRGEENAIFPQLTQACEAQVLHVPSSLPPESLAPCGAHCSSFVYTGLEMRDSVEWPFHGYSRLGR